MFRLPSLSQVLFYLERTFYLCSDNKTALSPIFNYHNMKKALISVAIAGFTVFPLYAQDEADYPFENLPDEYSTGKALGISRIYLDTDYQLQEEGKISPREIFMWYAALKYCAVTRNRQGVEYGRNRFETLVTEKPQYLPVPVDAEQSFFGCIAQEICLIDPKNEDLPGAGYPLLQWQLPAGANLQQRVWASNGYSWQTRLQTADMFMITLLQIQAYLITEDAAYLDRAAHQMVYYIQELQRPNGLFFPATDIPFYWGRANGWAAMGMVELLKHLPATHPDAPYISAAYEQMMESLAEYQDKDGLWNQLVDKADSWPETSASAMFTYALISGVKHKLLNRHTYFPVAYQGWTGLFSQFRPDDNSVFEEVLINSSEDIKDPKDKNAYSTCKRVTGDYYAQAAFVLCAYALKEHTGSY